MTLGYGEIQEIKSVLIDVFLSVSNDPACLQGHAKSGPITRSALAIRLLTGITTSSAFMLVG